MPTLLCSFFRVVDALEQGSEDSRFDLRPVEGIGFADERHYRVANLEVVRPSVEEVRR